MVVTLPFVLLLLDYWPLGRFDKAKLLEGHQRSTGGPRLPLRQLILEKIPLFALVAFSCLTTLFAQWKGGALKALEKTSIGDEGCETRRSHMSATCGR